MKIPFNLLLALMVLVLLLFPPMPARAGIAFADIPGNGKGAYVKLPDGTYAVLNADAKGNLAQSGGFAGYTALGYQQITSLSAAQALTPPAGATFAIVIAETQAVRWRPDGATTAPTASVGMPLPVATPLVYAGDLTAIKFIEQTTSAKLDIFYGK